MPGVQRLAPLADVSITAPDDRSKHSFDGPTSQVNRVTEAFSLKQVPSVVQPLQRTVAVILAVESLRGQPLVFLLPHRLLSPVIDFAFVRFSPRNDVR